MVSFSYLVSLLIQSLPNGNRLIVGVILVMSEVFHFQPHVVEEAAIPSVAALVIQLDCQSEKQLLCRRIGNKCRRKTQAFHGSLTVRTAKGIKGFFSFIDILIAFSSLNIGKIKATETSQGNTCRFADDIKLLGQDLIKLRSP